MFFSKELLSQMLEQGLVSINKHPELDLYIYNYTQFAQYERVWNEVTLNCRGLILNGANEVVARPFEKFFNLGEYEHQVIPDEPFEAFEKMDGSLGIIFYYAGKFHLATRGSFASEQSERGTQILNTKYATVLTKLNPAHTYLVEIIYPENRIVVDYHGMEDLILLAVIETATGKELSLEDVGLPMVKKYDGVKDLKSIKEIQEDNKEGFVIRFKSGLRVKVKFEEYVRVHRIVTRVSSISIWEVLKDKKTMDEILDRVPDEFYSWVKTVISELKQEYKAIEDIAKSEFKTLGDRKETALYFQTCKYPAILFAMLDNRDYSDIIWKAIRPKFARPFTVSEE